MIRVKLGWSAATTDVHIIDRVTLYRFLELPFAPFKGLRLANLLPNQTEPLEVVSAWPHGFVWDVEQNCFICQLEGEDFTNTSLAELLALLGPEWHVAEGWPGGRAAA
jgi:hypothetical protein